MNETLSVIDEHITDMNTPRSSMLAHELRGLNDSGSEYSSHLDHRLSYINGHETDEEERMGFTKAEVMQWDAREVAEHLQEIGLERKHCEVFREQEITGEVLLGMDQATVFMKELDLGVVGRRLRTWHKIKAFLEEVEDTERATSSRHGAKRTSPTSNTIRKTSVKGSVLPKIPNIGNHSNSSLPSRQESPRLRSNTDGVLPAPSVSPSRMIIPESPSRPSAASVREFNHSRRPSSIDVNSRSDVMSFGNRSKTSTPPTSPEASHKKQASFDRNWKMGLYQPDRTMSTVGSSISGVASRSPAPFADPNTVESSSPEESGGADLDRGYMSGGEAEGRKVRNVLRKNYPGSASHSRQSSQKDDMKSSSVSVSKRHSRFSSGGSIREALSSVKGASPILSSETFSKFRSKSTASTLETTTAEEDHGGSPLVTNLEFEQSPTTINSPRTVSDSASTTLNHHAPRQSVHEPTYRDKQDAILGIDTHAVDQTIASPTRTGSTTSGPSRSIAGSVESPAKSESAPSGVGSVSGTKRVKTKKDTSAYQKGLIKVSPRDAMKKCDYSGWMKKKSPKMTSTWKSRLFVLRGRRLGYFYSEDDVEEKGVIDISSHRVLPADNEFLTGLHATLTGAKSSPTSPANAQTITMNATEVAANKMVDGRAASVTTNGGTGMFIFKLVPPRAGLSRAISFTRQMVHYFAVDNVKQGRLWMAALMKATIDRDETRPVSTTYNQKTISLSKAISMKQRPPALMNVDEQAEANAEDGNTKSEPATASMHMNGDKSGLNIEGVDLPSTASLAALSPRTSSPRVPDSAPLLHLPGSDPDSSQPPPTQRSTSSALAPASPTSTALAPASPTSSALAPASPTKDENEGKHGPVTSARLRLVRSLSGSMRRSEDGRRSTDAAVTAGLAAAVVAASAGIGAEKKEKQSSAKADREESGEKVQEDGKTAESKEQRTSIGEALSSLA